MKRIVSFSLLLITIIVYFVIAQMEPLPEALPEADGENSKVSGEESTYLSVDTNATPSTDQLTKQNNFLDEIISKEPVITPSKVDTQEVNTIKGQGASTQESGESGSIEKDGGKEYTEPQEISISKPESMDSVDIEKMALLRIQQRPDIPLFSHRQHIDDMGIECVQCHQTLFAESVRGVKVGPSMKEICSQCHNGKDAPVEHIAGFSDEKSYVKIHMPLFSHAKHIEYTEKCNTCHRDIYGPLRKIKIPPPMSICSECHNNSKASRNCMVCHEDPSKLKPKSHTKRWTLRYGHGTDAKYNSKKCYECHLEKECYLCHRGYTSFKVHKPAYKYSHGIDAKQRVVNCAHCHDLNNSCTKCHTGKIR